MPGLYARYGIRLPTRSSAGRLGQVRCFTGRHQDRHPSCSVHLESGGFRCFTCNVGGGVLTALAYLGEPDRDRAREVAIEYGILQPDARPARQLAGPASRHRWCCSPGADGRAPAPGPRPPSARG